MPEEAKLRNNLLEGNKLRLIGHVNIRELTNLAKLVRGIMTIEEKARRGRPKSTWE